MTENQLRAAVVAQAREWLGRREADGSHMEIIRVYNAIRPLPRGYAMQPTDPWCAAFVSAVGAAVGLGEIIYPECACDPMIEAYRARGHWIEDEGYIEYLPAPGDLIFYDWQDDGRGDCTGSSDHVGIVAEVSGDRITVIEGNLSDRVDTRTIWRGGRYIRGFAVPDYKAAADMSGGATPQSPAATAPLTQGSQAAQGSQTRESVTVTLPVLRRGDGLDDPREDVRAAQLLLIGRGFRCGYTGADGEFGSKTKKAVEAIQLGYSLEVSGEIDAATWAVLLGTAR